MSTKWEATLLVTEGNGKTSTENINIELGNKAEKQDVKEAIARIYPMGYATDLEIVNIKKLRG